MLLVFAGVGGGSLIWGMNGEKKRKCLEPMNPLPAKRLRTEEVRKIAARQGRVRRKAVRKELHEMKEHLNKFFNNANIDPSNIFRNRIVQYALAFEIVTGGKNYLNPTWLKEKKIEYDKKDVVNNEGKCFSRKQYHSNFRREETKWLEKIGVNLGICGRNRLPKLQALNERLISLLGPDTASFSKNVVEKGTKDKKETVICLGTVRNGIQTNDSTEQGKLRYTQQCMALKIYLCDILEEKFHSMLKNRILLLQLAGRILKTKTTVLDLTWVNEQRKKYEYEVLGGLKDNVTYCKKQYNGQKKELNEIFLLLGMKKSTRGQVILQEAQERIRLIYEQEKHPSMLSADKGHANRLYCNETLGEECNEKENKGSNLSAKIDGLKEILFSPEERNQEFLDKQNVLEKACKIIPELQKENAELRQQLFESHVQPIIYGLEDNCLNNKQLYNGDEQISLGDTIEDDLGDDAWWRYLNETYIKNSTEII